MAEALNFYEHGYDFDVRENAPLGQVGWFRAGGRAKRLYKSKSKIELAAFLNALPFEEPLHVFGVLSNTIIRDGGVEGTVIRLGRDFTEIRQLDADTLYVGAMTPDRRVADFAAQAGISGLEFYSGIPGTIGGALKMNAGCYGTETKDVLVKAIGINRQGREVSFTPEELNMRYRHTEMPGGVVMIGAVLRGQTGDPAKIQAQIEAYKEKREAAQPIREQTGGSTFANPVAADLAAAGLPEDMKTWQLIDRAGGRGLRVGGAMMSEKHCNFMINSGGASAEDLENLGEEIRRRVLENDGISLRWEIRRIGKRV